MSAGVYALVGVVVGGVISVGGQAFLTWWQARRARKEEWLVASRLVSEELLQLMQGLRLLIDYREIPATLHFFETPLWTEYQAVIARHITDSELGDAFWRGLARVNAGTAPALRYALEVTPRGQGVPDNLLPALRERFDDAARLYEALAGVKAEVSLSTGPQPGPQEPQPPG